MQRKVFAKGSIEEQNRSKECKEKSLQKAAQRSRAGRKNAEKNICKSLRQVYNKCDGKS